MEENIVLMRRWFEEVWNEGRVQTVYDLCDENMSGVGQEASGVEIHGPADFLKLYNRLRGAFPDIKFTVEDTFGADDKVMVRWSAVATHTGDHLGVPATQRPVRITGITVARIAKGKVVEAWDNWDQLALMQQVAPAAAAANWHLPL